LGVDAISGSRAIPVAGSLPFDDAYRRGGLSLDTRHGRLGVLDEYCPHRRASLFLGRNEECGLRCLYHGWKMDVEGNILEMASEPHESGLVEKVKHKAYPAREAGGFVWTYMGPSGEMPDFQPPAWAPSPGTKISIVKLHVAANWAQTFEGGIDSAHSSSLHSTDMPPARVDSAKATATTWPRTPPRASAPTSTSAASRRSSWP